MCFCAPVGFVERQRLSRFKLIELLLECLEPLSRLAELTFGGQALVVREVSCGAGDERIARAD